MIPPKKIFFLPLPKKLFPLKNFRGTTIFLGGNNFLGRGEQIFRGGKFVGRGKKNLGGKGGILFRGLKNLFALFRSHTLSLPLSAYPIIHTASAGLSHQVARYR